MCIRDRLLTGCQLLSTTDIPTVDLKKKRIREVAEKGQKNIFSHQQKSLILISIKYCYYNETLVIQN